tara:strand:- start:144 stop:1001 length:858 start_codon:yes stop_codon:yes gene_type:complete
VRTEILLVTYAPDFDFTSYTLRSIAKFGQGFSGITIVVPYRDGELFKPMAEKYGCSLRLFYEAAGKGFLHHQVVKCEADLWCPKGTDLVVHIDSDCVFKEPFSVETFLRDDRPILVRERYADFTHYPARASWQKCVEHALGVEMPWETMVRHPGVFWVGMYRKMRQWVEDRHGYPFTQYVLLQRNEFPQTFAEFPTLGGFALAMPEWRQKYAVVTRVVTPSTYWKCWGIDPVVRDKDGKPLSETDYNLFGDDVSTHGALVSPVHYFWSRRGVTPEIRVKLEAILK